MLRDVAARWKLAAMVAANCRLQSQISSIAVRVRQPLASRRGGRPQGREALPQAALDGLAEFGARRELHLKRRSFARRRHHPDAAAVHLHDLLGDGEAECRPWPW